MKHNKISIVIPVYNEEENISLLFNEINDALKTANIVFEVIFVDDGSTDNTKTTLQNLSVEFKDKLKYLSHKQNYGQSAALLTGAKAAQYDILVTMDGDGQNDPRDIVELLSKFKVDSVILGIRKKRNDSYIKKISSLIGNKVRLAILNDGCKDTGCSLKVFSRNAFLNLPYFNHMHRYLPALFKSRGYNLVTVKVNHRARQHGVSKYGVLNRLFVGIHDLIGVRWLLKRTAVPEVINE